MNKQEAYSLDVHKSTLQDLRPAIAELKRRYSISSKAFDRRGVEPFPMKTLKARVEARPDIYEKKVGQLSLAEARSVYSTYRDYFARQLYDDTGHFAGYGETVTSTVSGYTKYIDTVAREILDYPEYVNMTQKEQTEKIWDIIDRIRDTDGSLFGGNTEPNILYQSGTNIKLIMSYIKDGMSDPEEIRDAIDKHIKKIKRGEVEAPTASKNPFKL